MMLLFLLAFACRTQIDGYEGTSVGNPGDMTARWAPSAGQALSGDLPVGDLVLSPCGGGEPTRVQVDTVLVPDAGQRVVVPGGEWCGLGLELTGPATVQAQDAAGDPATYTLELAGVTLRSAGFTVDGERYLLELGQPGWVEPGAAVAQVAQALAAGSALYADDGDGQLSDEERGQGPVASGEDREDDDDDDDGGDDDGGDDDGGDDDGGDDDGGDDDGGDDDGGDDDSG